MNTIYVNKLDRATTAEILLKAESIVEHYRELMDKPGNIEGDTIGDLVGTETTAKLTALELALNDLHYLLREIVQEARNATPVKVNT